MSLAAFLRFIAPLWKPVLAVLAAVGIYAKGRADAKAKRDVRASRDYQTTMERAADAPVHVDPSAARQRMRSRPADKR